QKAMEFVDVGARFHFEREVMQSHPIAIELSGAGGGSDRDGQMRVGPSEVVLARIVFLQSTESERTQNLVAKISRTLNLGHGEIDVLNADQLKCFHLASPMNHPGSGSLARGTRPRRFLHRRSRRDRSSLALLQRTYGKPGLLRRGRARHDRPTILARGTTRFAHRRSSEWSRLTPVDPIARLPGRLLRRVRAARR